MLQTSDSIWQDEEQQSPFWVFPSSQVSPSSIAPLPHTASSPSRHSSLGSSGQASTQSGAPSPSLSVSGRPQPQAPGSILPGSSGHRSTSGSQGSVLHTCSNGGQSAPPFDAGVTTVRVWIPPPHSTEQPPHSLTTQSTGQGAVAAQVTVPPQPSGTVPPA